MDSHWRAYVPDKAEICRGLVSIVIPARNAATTIIHTLQSVEAQSYRPLELIVIDDGSTDETSQVVEEWCSENESTDGFRFKGLDGSCRGAAAARNLGVGASSGEFIQFLDADDLLHPEKIARQVACAESHGATVFGDVRLFAQEASRFLLYHVFERNRPQLALQDWLEGRFIVTGALLWRRVDVMSNGPWMERLSLDDDGEYARRFLLRGGTWFYCEDSWLYYRTYLDFRPRVSTTSTHEALTALFDVIQATETMVEAQGRTNELREGLARQYWGLAKSAAYDKGVRRLAHEQYRRLTACQQMPEPWYERILYWALGIAGRKRLVTAIRRWFGLQPFRKIGAVGSVAELYAFDERPGR